VSNEFVGRTDFYDSPGSHSSLTTEFLVPGEIYALWKMGIHNEFKTYVMYRPNCDDAIWITLGKATWGWHAGYDFLENQYDEVQEVQQIEEEQSIELPVWEWVAIDDMKVDEGVVDSD
jgi:hypothetical protein